MSDQTERQSSSRRLAASGSRLPRPGERVGQYAVQKELGRGTMGAVYRAADPVGREVALKLLTPENQDPVGLLRFQREGRILAGLPAHQNVLRIHAMGVHGNLPWLALDLVEGPSLEDRLAQGPLTSREAVALVRKLCLAVDHVHRAGVLHRDLKAANVLLRKEDGEPVLTDFGLALLEGTEGLTRTGDLLGTPLYMSPEQLLGIRKEIDAQTDVWSLGVLLYRAVTGGYPFQAQNLSELARMVNHEDWTPLATRLGREDPALSVVLGRALAKRKLARYRSARDMAADLEVWPSSPTSRAPEAAAWVRRATVALSVLAGLLFLTLLSVVLLRPPPPPPATPLPQLDLSGAGEGPSRPQLEQLRRMAGPAALAAGQLLLAAEADRLARLPDLAAAAAVVSQLAPGPARDLLTARLALLRGTRVDEGSLATLVDVEDPAIAGAARVLLSRACRAEDPTRALALLSTRVAPAVRAREQEVARALAAVDQVDPLLLGDTAPSLRPELAARLRLLLGRALDEPGLPLVRVEALLGALGALRLPPEPDPLADRLLALLLPAPGPRAVLSLPVPDATRLWRELGAAGLRPTDHRRATHLLDMLVISLHIEVESLLAVLAATVQLDVDVSATHLHVLPQLLQARASQVVYPAGWIGEYLRLLHGTETERGEREEQDAVQGAARIELLNALRAGRLQLGPVHRARVLVQSVHTRMRPATAVAVLEEALALDPGNPWAMIQLAQVLTVVGRREESARLAVEGARRLEQLHGDRPAISWQRGIMVRGAIELLCDIDRPDAASELIPLLEEIDVPDQLRKARADIERAEARLRPPR